MNSKNNIVFIHIVLIMSMLLILKSCTTIPKGVPAVKGFKIDAYMGRWYEIARFDFYFEKNLNNTTAEYSLNEDGSVKVVNKGYNYKKNKEQKIEGKAKFVNNTNEAKLKVSFFGPFYSGYNVIAIDKSYKYALVSGKNFDYLWILSRETTIPDTIKQSYLELADSLGFNTKELIWVEHNN